jgi:hypothetical protein
MKVTIKIERADGQFTVAQTSVPDVPAPLGTMELGDVVRKISNGFLQSYLDCARLPS